MGKFIKRIKKQFFINIRRVAFEGISLTVVLSLILLLVISNIFRAINNGQSNYSIYQSEQKSLTEIEGKNDDLKKELEIVSSDEYQKLLAKEVLGIAEPGETLYSIDEGVSFYEVEKRLADVSEVESYSNWWMQLIGL
ncbi:hypothetical protein KC669_02630 [Candidatus Dojkabacteria bacterium]|uniref:Septum formation initiator family protein n=1 Tax=Candidatus Dojkabacteria bacterium TaxID=2099670 RepID=A0A955RM21_9BACT|nr:hypothetical protein [Candidatus Dojkabacteria bacterium]